MIKLDGVFNAVDAGFDLRRCQRVEKLGAQCSDHLVRPHLHGQYAIGLADARIGGCDLQDRIANPRMGRFANQQSLGLAREQQ